MQTRILHPFWEWDGAALTGWILTSPNSPKARHLADNPRVSLTYWDATHDTCSADCATVWELSPEERRAGWDRFAQRSARRSATTRRSSRSGPIPTRRSSACCGSSPSWLRVMPGSVMLQGQGEVLTWRA